MALALGVTHREAARLPPAEHLLFARHFARHPLEQLPRLVAGATAVHLHRKGKGAPPVLAIDVAPELYPRAEVEARAAALAEWAGASAPAPAIQAAYDRGMARRDEMMRLHDEAMAREAEADGS